MKTILERVLWPCILWCLSLSASGQLACEISSLNSSEHSFLEETIRHSHSKQLRRSSYQIGINAVIVHNDNELSGFANNEVVKLVNRANEYFSNIGLSFYIKGGFVNHIHSSEWQDLSIDEEKELRKNYDKSDALNIYFVKIIRKADGTTLNGYSSLPSYSANSNRLIYSYLNGTEEDFEILLNKTFLHELGHYFGLLHTYQNSATEDIEEREVVSRGIGANCSFTGDMICDTPADPQERIPSFRPENCLEAYPSDIRDRFGMSFRPSFDNIMSFHVLCGNVFTEQQYERMEAALAIRLSPAAEYTIAESDPNYIGIRSLNKEVYCAGDTVKVLFEDHGLFKESNKFLVELSNSMGSSFQVVNQSWIDGKQISFILQKDVEEGQAYRVRLSATEPAAIGFPSNHFTIKSKGEIKLEALDSQVQIGQTARLKVSMKGSGPWNFTLSNGQRYQNIIQPNLTLGVKTDSSTAFFIKTASQNCQLDINNNVAFVVVIQPSINIGIQKDEICEGGQANLTVSGLDPFSLSEYKIKISSDLQDYLIQPRLSSSSFVFQMPDEIKGGSNVKLKVIGEKVEDYSLPLAVKVASKPAQPSVISPVVYCFNESSKALEAFGKDLKWYIGEKDLFYDKEIIPETSESGINHFFVSQTNDSGCESLKSKIEVEVLPPVTGNISGETSIISGDSARLKINLTGSAPWLISLNDGTQIETFEEQFDYYVKPSNSTIYSITKLNNSCGEGFASGNVEVQVFKPLSSKSFVKNLSIYPNPTSQFVKITGLKTGEHSFRLLNSKGVVNYTSIESVDTPELLLRLPEDLNSGVYFLNIDGIHHQKLVIHQ
ncbi:zinc-dependent metalloprotease [Jiulongibacter sp. NS-SX5]|uniref:zinc-dependent metalloprotease n=1 Tax=Jiulongibacter sp. NS-SX5 TaxID=3463854 RepID=UPI00405A08B4